MRFELTSEQEDFAQTLDKLLSGADTVSAARAWADGDPAPGLEVWRRLAELGVTALLVPEDEGGMGATPVELAVAFESLGRHAVPGPWVESVAFLPSIDRVVSVAAPPNTPYALDADVADAAFLLGDGGLREASVGDLVRSIDPTRRLFAVTPGEPAGGRVPRRPHDGGSRLLRQQLAHRVTEGPLILRQGEPHRRGSPSTRSAAMFRWISLVPA